MSTAQQPTGLDRHDRDSAIFAAAAEGSLLGMWGDPLTVADFAEDTYGATISAPHLPTALQDASVLGRVTLTPAAAAERDRLTRAFTQAVEEARNEAVLLAAVTATFGDAVPYDALRQAVIDAFWMQQQVIAHEAASERGDDLYAAIDEAAETRRRQGLAPAVHRLQIWDAPTFAESVGVHIDGDCEPDGSWTYGYAEDMDLRYAEAYSQRIYSVGTALWAISAINRVAATHRARHAG